MVKAKDISWGAYMDREGPMFKGSVRFHLPSSPTEAERRTYVFARTEGGHLDSLNFYDKCIVSVGLAQWCENPWGLTSRLLGAIAEHDPKLLLPLQDALDKSNAEFVSTSRGWFFRFKDARGDVTSTASRTKLFFLHASGFKGSWDPGSKEHAKMWAAAIANTLIQPEAAKVQIDFTADRMLAFATPNARKLLFTEPLEDKGWVGAVRAAYLSFAGNLPAVAAKHLEIAAKTAKAAKWSEEWVIHVLRELTFGPAIAIYPHRYNAIRPALETLYGVDIPDLAEELQEFQQVNPWAKDFPDTRAIQNALLKLGYDLGPAGADNMFGAKTRAALKQFETDCGIDMPDGVPDAISMEKLAERIVPQSSEERPVVDITTDETVAIEVTSTVNEPKPAPIVKDTPKSGLLVFFAAILQWLLSFFRPAR